MSKQTYSILSQRIVPVKETHTGIFTGKQVVVQNNHGGQFASFIKGSNDFMAWGFGSDFQKSIEDALSKIDELAKA